MKRLIVWGLFGWLAAAQAAPQPMHRFDPESVRTIEGKITQVRAERGQGMPFLEVESGGKTVKVVLGSMRYLLSKDFNPKAGEKVRVEGFAMGENQVIARKVTLPESGKELELRDKDGRPLWHRGHHGRHGHHHRSESTEEKP